MCLKRQNPLRMLKSLIMLSGATLLSVWHDTGVIHIISLCTMRSLISA